MNSHPSYLRTALLGALAAGVCLVGTLALPFAVALAVGALLGNSAEPPPIFVVVMIAFTLIALFGGGAAWGAALARVTRYASAWRLALAGAISYSSAVLVAAFVLGRIEPIVVEGAPRLPIQILFMLLFVPTVFAVVALTGVALGVAVQSRRTGATTALGGGLAAALAFLAIDVLLDSLGMRVGAPRAEERATMLTVLALGSLGAALAGGAVFGVSLARFVAATRDQEAQAAQTQADHARFEGPTLT
jgi:hypothetical protein